VSPKIISVAGSLETDGQHYRLIEQLEAAVCSVSQNIAEGKRCFHQKEFAEFLRNNQRSMAEQDRHNNRPDS